MTNTNTNTLLPCKCCGDSDPNNALFGVAPELVPGVFMGIFTRCKICGEMSLSDGNGYGQYVTAWNRRHNAVLGAWLPIETAPKNKRILLGYKEILFNAINSVCGNWDDDRYANKPKPFWTHDMCRLKGLRETRAQQPVAWMPLPDSYDGCKK